jgi:hypothetical protein
MKKAPVIALAVVFGLVGATAVSAQRREPGTGPVAQFCQTDIEKLCPGATHGAGQARDCLEANKAKVSPDCAKALDSTGFGRRRQ